MAGRDDNGMEISRDGQRKAEGGRRRGEEMIGGDCRTVLNGE